MSRLIFALVAAALMSASSAPAAEPITLRDMGSFHVGGRLVEITGKPIKEVTFTPGVAFADSIKAAGGSVDVVDLPKIGIKGNSHMIMMDRNNAEVAGLIQSWLERKGLTK